MRLSKKSVMVRGERAAFLPKEVVCEGPAQMGIARYEQRVQGFSGELLNMVRLYLNGAGTALSDTGGGA